LLVTAACQHNRHAAAARSSSPPGPSVTKSASAISSDQAVKARFITAADATCAAAERQLKALPQPSGPSELVASLRAQLAVQQNILASLRRLSPAASVRAVVSAALLAPYQQAIARQQQLLPDIARAVASGDHVQLASLHTAFDTAGHPPSVITFVNSYGFTACRSFDYFRKR
jgi:hypothetical protein